MKKIICKVRYGFNEAILWASENRMMYYLLCVAVGLFIGLGIVSYNTKAYEHNVTYACNGETTTELVFDTDYGWSDSTWRINKYEYSGETYVSGKKIVDCCFDRADGVYYYEIYGNKIIDIR